MSELLLKVRNISLEYRTRTGILSSFSHQALNDVSFDVFQGEVVGLVGKNGAGKSTLLRILSGVMEPDSGSVWMPTGTTRSLLSIGLGFNNELTGRDNAILSCMFNGISMKDAEEIADNIKEFSELGDFFEQPIKTYSSGMKSRLGFSAGIISEVDLLMIDEVLAVGDAAFKKKAERCIVEKMTGSDKSVLFVSHNAKQIQRVCTRTIEL
ncbi:ABC transporter ATP-binding protein [Vibrio sp. SCSIO 43133]|uniref:ABC transporter ATP-binding protein n=1 Tax=Vibrio sp. SCSIO 43133 TaxID=2802577 RepID=UPI002075A61F|nr:ABC transporter ATP-binding protein [Vibrio sp. SCSIO 43133]USE00340.1 ABC transporter ATP-binding protein [Vibrio sp. SCSIO 43133]